MHIHTNPTGTLNYSSTKCPIPLHFQSNFLLTSLSSLSFFSFPPFIHNIVDYAKNSMSLLQTPHWSKSQLENYFRFKQVFFSHATLFSLVVFLLCPLII